MNYKRLAQGSPSSIFFHHLEFKSSAIVEKIVGISIGLLSLVILLAAAPSEAQSSRQKAAALLRAGNSLFDRQDYAGALEKYQAARAEFPSYKIDFNIGLAQEALNQLMEAAQTFDHFIATASKVAEPAMIKSAEEKLARLYQKFGRVAVACETPGAQVFIDEAQVGQTPLERRLYLRPGTYKIKVKATGHPDFSRAIALTANREEQVRVTWAAPDLRPVAQETKSENIHPALSTPAAPSSTSKPFYRTWWFWTATTAVVTVAIIGGVMAAKTGGDDRMPVGELGTIP